MAQDADVSSQSFVSDTTIRTRSLRSAAAAGASNINRGLEATGAEMSYFASPAAASTAYGNQMQRGSTFTPPRMIVLDTKYDGAVNITPWTGYAVQVVSKTGERTQVVGPATHLLEYDQTLDVISLSRNTPKNHDNLTHTVYLQITNNRVTDLYECETSDMVKVSLYISCRLNFEGDPKKWFAVDNYVKLLVQNLKSRLAAAAKQYEIGEFYKDAIAIVRDTILGPDIEGKERAGLAFPENGMRVYDVEVLKVTIADTSIQQLMQTTMVDAFKSTVEIENLRRKLQTTKEREGINQKIATTEAETKRNTVEIAVQQLMAEFAKTLKQKENELAEQQKAQEVEAARQQIEDVKTTAILARDQNRTDFEIARDQKKQDAQVAIIAAETTALVERLKGIEGSLGDVLLALSSQYTMQLLAEASAPMNMLGGNTLVDVIKKGFEGTGLVQGVQETLKGDGSPRRGLGRLMRSMGAAAATEEVATASGRR